MVLSTLSPRQTKPGYAGGDCFRHSTSHCLLIIIETRVYLLVKRVRERITVIVSSGNSCVIPPTGRCGHVYLPLQVWAGRGAGERL